MFAAWLPGLSATPTVTSDPVDGVDLGQRLLAGEVVVLANVIEVGLRCRLEVVEAFRGKPPTDPVEVAFRGMNLERNSGAPPFAPVPGEQAVFVLGPALDSRGSPDRTARLQPRGHYKARIPLPAEGTEALLSALREIVAFQDEPNQSTRDGRISEWIGASNPWLIDFALDQAARFGIEGERSVSGLIRRSVDASSIRRGLALAALGRWLTIHKDLADIESQLLSQAEERLVQLARADEVAAVRSAAVRALVALGDSRFDLLLRSVSREDPDQAVRYEAAAGLSSLGRTGSNTGSQSPR